MNSAKDIVEIGTNICVALAALAGVGIAWVGLRTWREQLRGTSRHEVARKILASLQVLGDAIKLARHNLVLVAEIRRGAQFITPPPESLRANPQRAAQAFGRPVWKALEQLKAGDADAVVIGKEARERLAPVFQAVGSFARAFSVEWDESLSPEQGELRRQTAEKWNLTSVLYERAENDVYAQQLGAALKDAEEYFRKYL